MKLPDYEPQGIPEGNYTFTVKGEPEQRRHQSARTGKDFISVKFLFVAEDDAGNIYDHQESFLPWEDRYQDLLLAFGGQPDEKGHIHGSDIEPEGLHFIGGIKYEQDDKDPQKKWARLVNIRAEGKERPKPKQEISDDDVPF